MKVFEEIDKHREKHDFYDNYLTTTRKSNAKIPLHARWFILMNSKSIPCHLSSCRW